MPMTEEQKELARQYRKQVYREQKDALDKIKRAKKNALRAEKEKLLWSMIKKADDLEAAHDEIGDGPR
jgi:hypothetical protein